MGRCEINLDEVGDGKRHRRWHPLLDKKGRADKKRGEVESGVEEHEGGTGRYVPWLPGSTSGKSSRLSRATCSSAILNASAIIASATATSTIGSAS